MIPDRTPSLRRGVIPSPLAPQRTVGVFDSGFGGLTVLRALLPRLPGTHFVYLGDTARLPYGAKSQSTVARFAIESARFLVEQGAQLLVIACNTATALALPEIRAAVPVSVLGVVEPGAQAALQAAATRPTSNSVVSTEAHSGVPGELARWGGKRSGESPVFRPPSSETQPSNKLSHPADKGSNQPNILILATAATVASHAYRDTCATLGLHAVEMPCPLLVPLVEEGWTDHPVTDAVLRIYLAEALARTHPAAVVLGCTHYPLLAPAIRATLAALGSAAVVVDAAEATAEAAAALWPPSADATSSTFTCYATDSTEKFAHLGSRFLGQPIPEVHLLDLGG